MRTIRSTNKFKRDHKRETSGNSKQYCKKLDAELREVVTLLASDTPLPLPRCDKPMGGEWKDHRDCHIRHDLVLIYRKPDTENLELVRLGSHSELGITNGYW